MGLKQSAIDNVAGLNEYLAKQENEKKKKKKKKESNKVNTNIKASTTKQENNTDISPVVKTSGASAGGGTNSGGIGGGKADTTPRLKDRWKEAMSDGYDFGDVTKSILGIGENSASLKELTVTSAKRGYYNAIYGEQSFKELSGESNNKEYYKNKLAEEEYQFTPKGGFAEAISGASEFLGQTARQISHPRATALATGAATTAALLGQAGPQVAIPEEIISVPAAMAAAYASAGAVNALEIEAGHAYNEMLEAGISKETAKKVALGVGTVNAGLELLQLDELADAYKVLKKSGASKSVTKKIADELLERGFDVAKETIQEVAQEGVTIGGTQLASKADTGEYAYSADEVTERLGDTAKSSALAFGMMNVPAVAKNTTSIVAEQNKANAANKLTADEEAVVNKVYEDEIAKAEKDGKALSNSEKNALREKVVEDMKKGYIDTDTIESVLGGDVYKMYKNSLDTDTKKRTELETEIDQLVKTPESQFTVEQRERLTELRGKLKELENDGTTQSWKETLDTEISQKLQNSRLAESYNEQTRRGQTFEADLRHYDAKQQAVIQKAIDSGILNNTNRTHDFVDMVAKISADKGVSFDFTDNEKLKNSGFALNGKTVNGYVTKDGITLNIDSHKSINSVVGHEITHVLEGTEFYTELQNTLFEYAKTKGEYDSRLNSLTELYKGVKDADVNAELTADLVGDYLFSDGDFITHLSTTNRNVFQKIYDEVKYLYKVATAGSKEARELERVKRAFDKAYKESGTSEKISTKYSLALDNQQNLVYNGKRGDGYVATAEFRSLQAESQRMSNEEWNFYLRGGKNEVVRRRVSSILQRQMDSGRSSGSFNNGVLTLTGRDNQFNVYEDVDPSLFHDVFEVTRKYLMNGELVDLHSIETTDDGVGYNDCYNYLSEDGLSGFSITPDGDLISVFNAGEKGGFLRAISGIVKERAKTLDCYVSPEQNLMGMYQRAFGFKTAAVMDYNMDYDHDNIAENHSMPKIAFMVNTEADVETRAFTKDQYDEAVAYRNSFLNQTSNNIAPTKETPSTDDVFFNGEKTQYSLSEDSNGNQLSPAVQKRFGNSKVVDENGALKVVYHGTATGEFSIFDKSKGSVEGDFGSGFYFTDNEADVSEHYEGGGPDFDNKVGRRADEIWGEESDIEYEEAERRAREELFKGSHKFEVYLNIENPAIVGETTLFDSEKYYGEYDREDYDSDEDYEGDVEQLIIDDIDGVIWDIQRNLDVDNTDGIANVLYDAIYNGGIDIESLKKNINDLYLDNDKGELIGNEVTRQIIESLGYDGIIDPTVAGKWNMDIEDGTTHYIVFKPNQIKAITNQDPTDNPDIHRSLSAEGEAPKRYGNYNVYGKDIKLEKAPMQNDISPIAAETANTMVNGVDNSFGDISPITEEEANAMASESLDSLTDADVPPEFDSPYYGEEAEATPDDPFENRDIKEVGNRKVKAYMYENPEVKPFFQAEARTMLGDLERGIKGERFYVETPDGRAGVYGSDSYGYFDGTKRLAHPDIEYLLDECHYTYKQIEDGLNAIIKDHGAENNAVSKRIEFLINDRLLNGTVELNTIGGAVDIPPNQDYIKLLNEKQIIEYNEEAKRRFFEVADEYAPISPDMEDIKTTPNEAIEDISPVVGEAQTDKYEAIRQPKQSTEPTTANEPKVKVAERVAPKTAKEARQERRKKNGRLWSLFRNHFVDKQSAVEDLSLKAKNRELMGKANFMLSSDARAQRFIAKGANGVRALNDIRKEVQESGLYKEFENYLDHKHNVDRMSIESNAKARIAELKGKFGHLRIDQMWAIATKEITDKTTERTATTIREAKEYLHALEAYNKPVFDASVTAEHSRAATAQYEAQNPQFVKWAREIYSVNKYLRQMMVDNGVITQETANLWEKMYPNYVPTTRVDHNGAAISVPLDTDRTGVNAPIKGATGGNGDMVDTFEAIADRVEQTFRAVAKNNFGVELKNTLEAVRKGASGVIPNTGTMADVTDIDTLFEMTETHDELLKKGKNGAPPTFTVFENGERVEFEITEDLYDALKPTSEGLQKDIKIFSIPSNLHKKVLTEYNLAFAITNSIKDAQSVIVNSQHPVRTYLNFPEAMGQLIVGRGKWVEEYMTNGGEDLTYFEGDTKRFKDDDSAFKKIVGFPLKGISTVNNFVERIPRLAEYIASRKAGASVEVAMLDAARVTTNFAAGGDVTKFANRNGATFLNASVQGAAQQVRNIREAKAKGLKGVLGLVGRYAAVGLPAVLFNSLMWDDDEEYEELSDYVKDNYYVVAKFGDGKFVRIPKGREVAVIQKATELIADMVRGEDDIGFTDVKDLGSLALSNLAPNNPIKNNIISPISQARKNEAWYGGDIVPTRLQDVPANEQFDESIDSISKWLGEKTNTSPYKINYLLDQYSGIVGDMFLPMLTPEAEGSGDTAGDKLIAPIRDKFSTDSVTNNKTISDFYDTKDELTTNAKSVKATDEDVLKYKYINSVNEEISELYKQQREIQNSNMTDGKKYIAVRNIQKQINELAESGMNTYGSVKIDSGYATVGNRQYRLNDKGEWTKLTDDQISKQNKVTRGLDITPSEYWGNKEEYDFAYEKPEKYAISKSVGGYNSYKKYTGEIYDIKGVDLDGDGRSDSGTRKDKVVEYLNNLDIDYYEKLILFKSEYNADDTYNYEIIEYLNSRADISYEDTVTILKELGFKVDSRGNVTWD